MKKILSAIFAVALLAGCSKKKDVQPKLTPQNATVADITGKWNVQADSTFQVVNGKAQLTSSEKAPNITIVTYLQFNTDGTVTESDNSASYTYSVANGAIKTYLINQDGSKGNEEDLIIRAITQNSLLLRLNESDTVYEDVYMTK